MLTKALITSVVAIMALINTGNAPASASGACPDCPQDMRPTPQVVGSAPSIDYSGEGDEVREEFHQTYPLSLTGRVALENINGGVQIKIWDRAAVQVDAVKRANRKERLAEAKIDVDASEESIRIKSEYPDWNQNYRSDKYDNPATIDYILTVPRKAALESIELINGSLDIDGVEGNVKGSSINGRVTARGLMGETKLSTINGSLQANFTQLDQAKGVYLQSVNGNVTLVIPSNANALVRASTVHGGISNDFGLQVRDGEYVGHDLEGQIGTGGPRIKLGNVNGAIRITHAQDGRALSPGTSLLAEKQSSDETRVIVDREIKVAIENQSKVIDEATKTARKETAKAAKESARDQRQVDVALRQAQREVERAQAEIQREVQQQANEQMREQARLIREQSRAAAEAGNRGRGAGSGTGEGVSSGSRFTAQETKSFTIEGTPRVNVSTFDGAVTVHGWDKSEVMYTATKRADDEEQLKQINIRTEQQGPSVSIIATADDQDGSVALDVYVPRRASLHVSSDDGRLNLEGVSGDLTLRTGDGSIEVSNGGGQLQVNTGDGRIHVANFEGQVDARTGDGSISLDGSFNAVTARTGDGSITLAVPANSNFTIETNAEDAVTNEGLTITEDVSPSQRVKRWRVGSGGKVFVLNTGDGKIVLRSR